MKKDPVCNMDIPGGNEKLQLQHQGQTYDFCSESCLKKFKANPDAYVPHDHSHGEHP